MQYTTTPNHKEAVKTARFVQNCVTQKASVGLPAQDIITLAASYLDAVQALHRITKSADYSAALTEAALVVHGGE